MNNVNARKQLAARGIGYSEAIFIRYVKAGDTEVVRLFASAGINPNAAPEGVPALAVALTKGHDDVYKALLEAGADPALVGKFVISPRPKKDFWKVVASLSGVFTFLSTVLIAIIGWHFTNKYNDRQLEISRTNASNEEATRRIQNHLSEVELVEKMIPHLSADEKSRQTALQAISVLADQQLATRIAVTYGGPGAIEALKRIAFATFGTGDSAAFTALVDMAGSAGPDAQVATAALSAVLAPLAKGIVVVAGPRTPYCLGVIVAPTLVATPSTCELPNDVSKISAQFSDGVPAKIISVKRDDLNLLELLKLSGSPHSYLLAADEPLATDDFAALYAGPRRPVVVGKTIQPTPSILEGVTVDPNRFYSAVTEISLGDVSPGAPILDRRGRLACVAWDGDRHYRDLEICIRSAYITNVAGDLLR